MVGDNLRMARMRKGLTQSDVAEKIGCAATCLTNWESGRINPPLEKLEAMCRVYGVSPLDILEGSYGIEEVGSIARKPLLERNYEETVALTFCGDLIANCLEELSACGKTGKADLKMRDENRIPIVLEELKKVWEKHTDWRLGQLIVNIARSAGYGDPFFIEDDRLVKEIRRWEGAENAVET